MYTRILVPLDGSQPAEAVLSFATMLAEQNGAELVLLRVAEYSFDMYSRCYEYPPTDPALAKEINEKKRAVCLEAKRYLDILAERLQNSGYKVSVKVYEGPVVDAISDCVEDLHADLIIMSTHASSGYGHRLIGTIADRVLHEARVPVLLVRANPGAWASNHHYWNETLQVRGWDTIHGTRVFDLKST